ncbi:hypothetical protein MY11210_009581 [Beauveria gryllotalpidicola]
MPHRPTKEELLAAANGFWERLRVRLKWMSIRSMRPWNADEWGAFVSWFLFGHLVWILVGTTTFFSLLILSINTVFAQETLAKWVGDYLTQSAGVTVIFESAIVPKWGDGVIAFRNVFVSRRPGQVKSSVSKGSYDEAAAAAAGRQAQLANTQDTEDDGNYTQFDMTIANVNVTLSFLNWWNGKGLLKDVEVNGVRGVLRKQWIFYDFLAATHVSGSFDGSLFTIHPRQVHGIPSNHYQGRPTDADESKAWKKSSRLRIDGLKIDHLNRGVEGPFGWIYEGDVDIVADVMFPADTDESLSKVMADFYDQLEEVVTANRNRFLRNTIVEEVPQPLMVQSGHISEAATAPPPPEEERKATASARGDEDRHFLIMDLRIHLNDVKAAMPLFTKDMSYVNQALIRPIVAYINAKKTYIPISCRIVKRLSDFDGSWTVLDCGLMDDASAETYEAFAQDIEDRNSRVRRFKKVGFWTLSLAIHALFLGMAGNVV